MKTKRLPDIERAKGLAILLVVAGHLVANEPPPGHEWYAIFKHALYKFHMPFFMYLSGFVFFFTHAHQNLSKNYGSYVFKRAERLLLPFLVFGVLIVCGKYLAQFILHVDNTPEGLLAGFSQMIFETNQSPAISIWYIFVLFLYCIITPVLWNLTRGRILILLAIAMALYLVPFSDDFYLDRAGRFYIFFTIGGLVALHREQVMRLFKRGFPVALIAFTLSFTLMMYDEISGPVKTLVIGLLSIPALHQLVRLPCMTENRTLLIFGSYSFSIYLLNTIMIGLAKGLYMKILPFADIWFILALPVLFVAGAIGPVVLKQKLFPLWPYANRLTD